MGGGGGGGKGGVMISGGAKRGDHTHQFYSSHCFSVTLARPRSMIDGRTCF